MGVFATRTPHRPCPIGLTVAKVLLKSITSCYVSPLLGSKQILTRSWSFYKHVNDFLCMKPQLQQVHSYYGVDMLENSLSRLSTALKFLDGNKKLTVL
jgi:hypothetical protein